MGSLPVQYGVPVVPSRRQVSGSASLIPPPSFPPFSRVLPQENLGRPIKGVCKVLEFYR